MPKTKTNMCINCGYSDLTTSERVLFRITGKEFIFECLRPNFYRRHLTQHYLLYSQIKNNCKAFKKYKTPMIKIHAPFTPTQIKNLKNHQQDNTKHPYTCNGCNPAKPLRVSTNLLRCPYCGYNQYWALSPNTEQP